VGTLRRDGLERMVVDAPAGLHRGVLRYEPPTLPWALGATLLGILLVIGVGRLVPRARLERWPVVVALALAIAGVLAAYLDGVAAAREAHAPRPSGWTARASAYNERELNSLYQPWHAIDGDPDTEWHLPDGQRGWIELRADEPRPVAWIRLLNARNERYRDRAVDRVRVRAFAGGEEVASYEVVVPTRWDGQVATRDVHLRADPVDRIRVEVSSWHRLSGGLAEIEVVSIPREPAPRPAPAASSSARGHGPARALDDRDASDWRPAPGDPAPWVELRYGSPRRVAGVLILPCAGGARRFRVRAWPPADAQHEVEGPLHGPDGWVHVPVRARGVERLRVEPRPSEGERACVAELRAF